MVKVVKFLDVSFPVKKHFARKPYQRVYTFPISKNAMMSFKEQSKQKYDMKVIPVINISVDLEYMVYIREKTKIVRK